MTALPASNASGDWCSELPRAYELLFRRPASLSAFGGRLSTDDEHGQSWIPPFSASYVIPMCSYSCFDDPAFDTCPSGSLALSDSDSVRVSTPQSLFVNTRCRACIEFHEKCLETPFIRCEKRDERGKKGEGDGLLSEGYGYAFSLVALLRSTHIRLRALVCSAVLILFYLIPKKSKEYECLTYSPVLPGSPIRLFALGTVVVASANFLFSISPSINALTRRRCNLSPK
jgi:hypothetical protein